MQGFNGLSTFSRAPADGARAGDHLRTDGRHQHGPRRVPDHRCVHDVPALGGEPALGALDAEVVLPASPSSSSFVLAAGIGLLVEHVMVRHLYRRPLDTLLATWGLSLIMQQGFRSIFGAKEVSAMLPEWLMGSFQPIPSIDIPINGVFVMALTLVLTTLGLRHLAQDALGGLGARDHPEPGDGGGRRASTPGRVDRAAFALGCGLAGIAGAAFTTIGSTGPDQRLALHRRHVPGGGVRRRGEPGRARSPRRSASPRRRRPPSSS